MTTTPRSKTVNEAKRVLMSIPLPEEISVNLSIQCNGFELENALAGVTAFTKVFCDTDMYRLDVKVVKIIHVPESKVDGVGKDKQPTD